MVSSSIGCAHSVRNGSLMSLGKAAQLLGCHPNSLRRYCDDGLIECQILPSGHRRISQRAIDAYNGVLEDDGKGNFGAGITCYARVSDISGKAPLDRQIERLLIEVSQRENIEKEEITIYKDLASSFGDREGLNRLVDSVINGQVKKIYCLYLDRLSRVPALTRLLESICKRFGVEIIALDVEDCETQDVWQKELLGYITVWCNRQSAQKSIAVTKREVSPECIERIIQLRKEGRTAAKIWKRIIKEGYKAHTQIGEEHEISYTLVRQILTNSQALIGKVKIDKENNYLVADKTFFSFIESKIKQCEYDEGKISINLVYKAYCLYCESHNEKPQFRNVLGRFFREVFGKHNKRIQGQNWWCGLKLI